jgi:hypothetical protein
VSEHRDIPEPGELVYTPRPSWAPMFLAFGTMAMICGVFANGFILPAWVYAAIGAVFFIGAFRNLVRGAIRDYFRLPRRQRARGAVLPVETINPLKD